MRAQDIQFLLVCIVTMALGVMLPFLAEPMRWVPRAILLVLFFVSFVSIDSRDAWRSLMHFPGAVALLAVIKLLVLPFACWAVFRLVLPEFAFGAALLGGCSAAVAAPLLAFMLQADIVLALAGLVVSSLLLPLVLPCVLNLLSGTGGGAAFPVRDMMLSLALTIIVPFCAAQYARRVALSLMEKIARRRMHILMVCMGLGNLAIFSRYAFVLTESPSAVVRATGAAFLACFVIFTLSAALTWWMPPDRQLTVVISCVGMNNVLMLIVSAEFFTVAEALITALYTVPFYAAVFLYRLLSRVRRQ